MEPRSADHLKEAERIRVEIYSKMSPLQKLQELDRLHEVAWALKKAGVRMLHPDWSAEQVDAEVRRIFLYAST